MNGGPKSEASRNGDIEDNSNESMEDIKPSTEASSPESSQTSCNADAAKSQFENGVTLAKVKHKNPNLNFGFNFTYTFHLKNKLKRSK